jgi:hypothetical protein
MLDGGSHGRYVVKDVARNYAALYLATVERNSDSVAIAWDVAGSCGDVAHGNSGVLGLSLAAKSETC